MTMQSYFCSGTGGHDIDAPPHVFGEGLRPPGRVVVAHEHAPAVGHEAAIALGAHLEVELQARALQLARPDPRADLVVEERRRAVRDVALGEDEPEARARPRGVLR